MSARVHRHRREVPGNTRFLTFSCYQRLPLFGNAAIRDAFAEAIGHARDQTRFRLFGWVIMPEHVHLLVCPDLPRCPVSRVLHRLKKPFADRVLTRWRELEAPILDRVVDSRGVQRFWQRGGGYDRNIRGVDDFYERLRYIHRNPVTRGLVERAVDWPWSSARAYRGGGEVLIEVDRYDR